MTNISNMILKCVLNRILKKKCICAKSLQSHLTLCNPMDCSPQGFSVHGILQTRILEWVTYPPPGDLPNPGIEPTSFTSTCISQSVLYR